MKIEIQRSRKALLAALMVGVFVVSACGDGDSPAPVPVPSDAALLTWTAPAGSPAGYRVYYGTASRTYSQPVGSGTYVREASFMVTGLAAGNTYYFAVTSVDANGGESEFSNEATKLIQ